MEESGRCRIPLAISVFKEGIECVYVQEFDLGV